MPVYSGCVAYFPLALAEVARLSRHGNDKHNPGQPLHWSRDKSSDHLDCIARHLLECGKADDDGFLHDVKVAWRALANLQLKLEAMTAEPAAPVFRPGEMISIDLAKQVDDKGMVPDDIYTQCLARGQAALAWQDHIDKGEDNFDAKAEGYHGA